MDVARSRRGEAPPAPPIGDGLEAELREQIVMGTPGEVAARIHEFAEAAGGDVHYIARLYFPGMAPEIQREAMRIFAEEVIPELR